MDNKGTERDIREFLPSPLLEKPIASDVIAESGAVFVKLLQYFPESAYKELYARVLDYSTLCLASGDFANAENYARMVLAQDDDGKRSAEATLLLLFAKLKCRTYDEFLHCTEFADNMPEYRDVIKAYSINSDAMGCAIALSRANAATVAHDREVEAARLAAEAARIAAEKQREAERIAEEARRREEAARQAAHVGVDRLFPAAPAVWYAPPLWPPGRSNRPRRPSPPPAPPGRPAPPPPSHCPC